jgi:hypothetical protein
MQKVGSAVERIRDDDDSFFRKCRRCQLFAEHGRTRQPPLDRGGNLVLRCFINIADEVRLSFRLPDELLTPDGRVANDSSGAASCFQRDAKQLLIAWFSS